MLRDISPTQWAAPGIARLGLDLLLSSLSNDPLPIDDLQNSFSPIQVDTVKLVNSGPTPIPVPDTTHGRFLIIILPRQNVTTAQFRWNNADTGKYCNPQGILVETFDPNHCPTNLYYVVGADISGVTLIWG